MANILILFSSTDGHTEKTGKRLKQVIEESPNQVKLVPVVDFHQVDLDFYDKIIIGASIRCGKHNPSVLDFINSHLQLL